jgi:hypothetical protein
MRMVAHTELSRADEFFNTHPFQGMDDLLQFRRQRPHIVSQFGDQFVLNHVPALQGFRWNGTAWHQVT